MERLTYRDAEGHARWRAELMADDTGEAGELIRNKMAELEDIVENCGISKIMELVDADRDGRIIITPAQIGDSVYHITTCKNFSQVLDGTMWGPDGGYGTATGYYCPCELSENCPFQLEKDGTFDCEKHKNTPSIYEDVVTGICIDVMGDYVILDYSGSVNFEDFGKTVFLTREAAEDALKASEEDER